MNERDSRTLGRALVGAGILLVVGAVAVGALAGTDSSALRAPAMAGRALVPRGDDTEAVPTPTYSELIDAMQHRQVQSATSTR